MTPAEILDAASGQVGLPGEAGPAIEGFRQAHSSLREEMDPSPLTELVFDGACVRQLSNYLALEELARRQRDTPSPPNYEEVVVIVGLPRTGTTLLHNLLAAEPGTAFLTHLDLHHSWWRLAGDDRAEASVDIDNRLALMDALDSRIRDIHPVQPHWPDECTLVFENSFASYQWPATYGLPSYFDWLDRTDLEPHYDVYRRAVDVLVGPPRTETRRLVLKSPFHLLHVDALRRVLPSATLINLVRRSETVVASWLQLVTTTHDALFDGRAMPDALRDRWIALLARMAQQSMAISDHADCLTLAYDDLATKPFDGLLQVLAHLGRPLTPEHRARAELWMDEPEAARRGPGAKLTQFSVAAEHLPPELSAYDDRFGLR